MSAFVNPELRVNTLTTVPNFTRLDALLKYFCEFNVPYTKALWLVKVLFNSARGSTQKDDFAQGIADTMRNLAPILFSRMSSTNSTQNQGSSTNSNAYSNNATSNASSSAANAPSQHSNSASGLQTPSKDSSHLSLSSSSATLASPAANIQFPKLSNPGDAGLAPDQINAKSSLLYTIRLLRWAYRDGFIQLGTLVDRFSADFASCSDACACLYLSALFQFLPDIIVNYPALERFKTILSHVADKFSDKFPSSSSATSSLGIPSLSGSAQSHANASTPSGMTTPAPQSNTGARPRLFSLYCSTLKVLVAYLPDFFDPQTLDTLRRYIASAYIDPMAQNPEYWNNSEPESPSLGMSNAFPYASNRSQFSSRGSSGCSSTGVPCMAINPYHLTPSQAGAFHMLQQNINANRIPLIVDSVCYDHVCSLIMNSNFEGAATDSPIGPIGRNSPSSHTMSALNALDSFARHLDLEQLYNALFLTSPTSFSSASSTNPGSVSGFKLSSNNRETPQTPPSRERDMSGSVMVTGEALERTFQLVCSWAVAPFRTGVHRAYVASSLIRRYLTASPACADLVSDLLIDFIDSLPCPKNTDGNHDDVVLVASLIGELIRNRAFSHDKYLRRLISRGILLQSHIGSPSAIKHRSYLLNVPLYGECKHDRLQRTLTIQRYLESTSEESDVSTGIEHINNCLFHRVSMDKVSGIGERKPIDPEVVAAERELFKYLNSVTLFSRCATGQYAIASVKYLLTQHFTPAVAPLNTSVSSSSITSAAYSQNTGVTSKAMTNDTSHNKSFTSALGTTALDHIPPNGFDATIALSDLGHNAEVLLVQRICVLLEHIADFRSMIDFGRWLLDRVLRWDLGNHDLVSRCLVPLFQAYEHVTLALDFPMAPFLERFLILAQRCARNISHPTAPSMVLPHTATHAHNTAAALLVKFVAKNSAKVASVGLWAAEKGLSLDALKRAITPPPASTKPSIKLMSSHTPPPQNSQSVAIANFVAALKFVDGSTLLATPINLPKLNITQIKDAQELLELVTEAWFARISTVVQSQSMDLTILETISGACGSANALQTVLSQCLVSMRPSDVRNALGGAVCGAKMRKLLNDAGPQVERLLVHWIDSLCTWMHLSGTLILGLAAKVIKFAVVGLGNQIERSFFSFVLLLLATLAHYSATSIDGNEKRNFYTPARWLHSLGRPIKKKALQTFVSFCGLLASYDDRDALLAQSGFAPCVIFGSTTSSEEMKIDPSSNSDAFSHPPSHAPTGPSANSLMWFLGESLLSLPHEDMSEIFRSLGDSQRAFQVCSLVFSNAKSPTMPPTKGGILSASGTRASATAVKSETSMQVDSHSSHQGAWDAFTEAIDLRDVAQVEERVNSILSNTHIWSVRFTSLQLQLLLDAANDVERQRIAALGATTPNAANPKRVNEIFASALMQRLSRNILCCDGFEIDNSQPGSRMDEDSNCAFACNAPSSRNSAKWSEKDKMFCEDPLCNSSEATVSLLRRLGAGVRLDLLTYLFGLIDPSKHQTTSRCFLSAALLGKDPDSPLKRGDITGDESNVSDLDRLSANRVERKLIDLLLAIASCCIMDGSTPNSSQMGPAGLIMSPNFPIDQVLEPHLNYIEEHVMPHLNNFSKWRNIRTQMYIRLSLIRWVVPSETIDVASSTTTGGSNAGGSQGNATNTGAASSMNGVANMNGGSQGSNASQGTGRASDSGFNAASVAAVLDKLTILLLRLLASPALQESVFDGRDLWTLALHSFAALKNCHNQTSTRRAINELYPTLTMPSHLRIRLEAVIQSSARKDRPAYLINGSRMFLPKGIDPTRQLEEQPDANLLNAFGARKVLPRQLTYANHLLSAQTGSLSFSSSQISTAGSQSSNYAHSSSHQSHHQSSAPSSIYSHSSSSSHHAASSSRPQSNSHQQHAHHSQQPQGHAHHPQQTATHHYQAAPNHQQAYHTGQNVQQHGVKLDPPSQRVKRPGDYEHPARAPPPQPR